MGPTIVGPTVVGPTIVGKNTLEVRDSCDVSYHSCGMIGWGVTGCVTTAGGTTSCWQSQNLLRAALKTAEVECTSACFAMRNAATSNI